MDAFFSGNPTARFMHERPEGLLVALDVTNQGTAATWVMMVDPDGTESWRKTLAPCGEAVATGLPGVAVGPEHLFVLASVRLAPDTVASVIVEVGFDGELQAVRALAGAPEGTVYVERIAANGDVVVVSGLSHMPGYVFTSWIARIH
jgi:hypothetical protein